MNNDVRWSKLHIPEQKYIHGVPIPLGLDLYGNVKGIELNMDGCSNVNVVGFDSEDNIIKNMFYIMEMNWQSDSVSFYDIFYDESPSMFLSLLESIHSELISRYTTIKGACFKDIYEYNKVAETPLIHQIYFISGLGEVLQNKYFPERGKIKTIVRDFITYCKIAGMYIVTDFGMYETDSEDELDKLNFSFFHTIYKCGDSDYAVVLSNGGHQSTGYFRYPKSW